MACPKHSGKGLVKLVERSAVLPQSCQCIQELSKVLPEAFQQLQLLKLDQIWWHNDGTMMAIWWHKAGAISSPSKRYQEPHLRNLRRKTWLHWQGNISHVQGDPQIIQVMDGHMMTIFGLKPMVTYWGSPILRSHHVIINLFTTPGIEIQNAWRTNDVRIGEKTPLSHHNWLLVTRLAWTIVQHNEWISELTDVLLEG